MKTYEQQLKWYYFKNLFWKLFDYTAIIILIILIGNIFLTSPNNRNTTEITNTVELHAKYRNYVLIYKQRIDSLYEFTLVNPYTADKEDVFVNDWVYYNLYFVGDTINKQFN